MEIPAFRLLKSLSINPRLNSDDPDLHKRCGHCESCRETSERLLRSPKCCHPQRHMPTFQKTGDELKIRSHRSCDLLAWCKSIIDPENERSAKQISALNQWDGFRRNLPLGFLPTVHNLRFWMPLFDDYFFDGAFQDLCCFDLVDGSTDTPRLLGRTYEEDDFNRTVHIEIINPQLRWTKSLLQQSVDTLLHEMAHAFFRLYACRCGNCDCVLVRARGQGLFKSGHGPLWRRLVSLMEMEAARIFPPVDERWTLDGDPGSCAHLRELEAMVDLVVEGQVLTKDLDALRPVLFSGWSEEAGDESTERA